MAQLWLSLLTNRISPSVPLWLKLRKEQERAIKGAFERQQVRKDEKNSHRPAAAHALCSLFAFRGSSSQLSVVS